MQSSQNKDITIGRFNINENISLSVAIEDGVANTRIPYATVEGIWRKANLLISDADAIVSAPGFGKKDKMVKSTTGTIPHLIISCTKSSGVQYNCDDRCPHYKSIGICSHIVAVAEKNSELEDFLEWFRKKRGKQNPNLSAIGTHGMPAGAGKKGEKPAKKKGPKKSIPTDENRIPLDVASATINTSVLQQQKILLIHTIHICGLTGLPSGRMLSFRLCYQHPRMHNSGQMFGHRHHDPYRLHQCLYNSGRHL